MIRTSKFTVAQLRGQFGVTRGMVRNVMYNQFTVPADYKLCLDYYKLFSVSGIQFMSLLRNGELACTAPSMKGVRFNIIYKDCTPYHVKRAKRVLISYRTALEEFNIEPIVIVRIDRNLVTDTIDIYDDMTEPSKLTEKYLKLAERYLK